MQYNNGGSFYLEPTEHQNQDSGVFLGTLAPNIQIIFLDKQSVNEANGQTYVAGSNILTLANSVSVNREESTLPASCNIVLENVNPTNPKDFGYFSPYRNGTGVKIKNDWYHVITPGARIQIKAGYGSNLYDQFTGVIWDVNPNINQESIMTIQARDYLGKAIDDTVCNPLQNDLETKYYLDYPTDLVHSLTISLSSNYDKNTRKVTGTLSGLQYAANTYNNFCFNLYTWNGSAYVNTDTHLFPGTTSGSSVVNAFSVSGENSYYIEAYAKYGGTWWPAGNGTGTYPSGRGFTNEPADIANIAFDLLGPDRCEVQGTIQTHWDPWDALYDSNNPNKDILTGFINYYEFEQITYAECLKTLCETVNYHLWCDNSGVTKFKPMAQRNTSRTGSRKLSGTNLMIDPMTNFLSPFNYQIAYGPGAITVKSSDNVTTYTYGTDYEVDIYQNAIKRTVASTIPNNTTVNITYINCDYTFADALRNLIEWNYDLNHADVFGTIIYSGDGTGPIARQLTEVGSTGYGQLWDGSLVSLQKVKFVTDETEMKLDTEEKLAKYADQAWVEHLARYCHVKLNTIFVPQLEMYDLIQPFIFGNMSDVYKVVGLNWSYTPSEAFTQEIVAYRYTYQAP